MSKEEKAKKQAKIIEQLFLWLGMIKQMGLDVEFLKESSQSFIEQVEQKESIGIMFNMNALEDAKILKARTKVLDCIIALFDSINERDEITQESLSLKNKRSELAELF
ncbi:hypothetical protein LCGC14_1452790 [marine sediment metagenome]|uniref:Uncharacterized protein n=2 Tax=root TaxID=1 RepID=A0A831QM36_9FLAO|nr:hypothetical protein [Methylophaga sp.]HEA19661.1 hypothetical protein [Pricia antarctica]